MTDPSSDAPSSDPHERPSLFDVAAAGEEAAGPERVRVLKRVLFDLAYLVVNADGTEHVSEQVLIRELEGRMEREGSVDVEARARELDAVLDGGPEAVRTRVEELAAAVVDRAGERTREVGARYLDLLKGLVVADATVDPVEYELYDLLCTRWDVENTLPSP
jgi:hypothetical protein